jgi:hypothetical protein
MSPLTSISNIADTAMLRLRRTVDMSGMAVGGADDLTRAQHVCDGRRRGGKDVI